MRADRPYSVLFQHLLPIPCSPTNQLPSSISLDWAICQPAHLEVFSFHTSLSLIRYAYWPKRQTSNNTKQNPQGPRAKHLSQPTRPTQLLGPEGGLYQSRRLQHGWLLFLVTEKKKGLSCGSLAYCLHVCLAPLKPHRFTTTFFRVLFERKRQPLTSSLVSRPP